MKTPRPSPASRAGAALRALRKTSGGGGRPRSDAPRCACQAMTLKRAMARGKSREHQAGCAFALIETA